MEKTFKFNDNIEFNINVQKVSSSLPAGRNINCETFFVGILVIYVIVPKEDAYTLILSSHLRNISYRHNYIFHPFS